jgi:hypothetical protein
VNNPLVRRRIDELIDQGMAPTRARHQAVAELAKGILAAGGCCLLDNEHDHERKNRKGA